MAITSSGLGLTDVNYKRNLDIVQQDRDGTTLRRWSLSRAWPVKLRPRFASAVLRTRPSGSRPVCSRRSQAVVVAGDWDNEADENVIESVTLSYDYFELIQ